MRFKRFLYLFLSIVLTGFILFKVPNTDAFEVKTHKDLNEWVATHSIEGFSLDIYLRNNLGFNQGIEQPFQEKTVSAWIEEGGEFEDNLLRFFNHFHDPLKPWDQSGFKGNFLSSILWAQTPVGTQALFGDWSWHDARSYFYEGLISPDPIVREENLAKTFRAVGQLMHLVEDVTVPAHTRDDAHPFSYSFETWASSRSGETFNAFLESPIPFNPSILDHPAIPLAPVPFAKIFDADQYDGTNPGMAVGQVIGLAEYTNANFFSEDTIDSSIPFPNLNSAQRVERDFLRGSGQTYRRNYYLKIQEGETDNSQGYLLANVDWLDFYRQKYPALGGFLPVIPSFDSNVYEDYANLLLPRAVGYSAGLLNYFFRGTISLSLPNGGVYGITSPDGSFNEVRIDAQNITDSDEEMSDGEIQLAIKYKLALEDPMEAIDPPVSTSPEFLSHEFNYIVVPEANGARSIPRDTPVELIFDLSSNPLPILATDVYLQVVYRGVLGGETDAVAVGFKDASEPTPVDVISSLDYVCLDGFFVKAGSLEAELFLDGRNLPFDFDFYAHRLNDVRIKFGPSGSFPDASLGSHNARFLTIEPAQFGRVYVLTEYTFSFGVSGNPGILDPRDDPDIVDFPFHDPFSYVFENQMGVRHQTDIENQVRVYPLFEPFRGIKTFTGSVINISLPGGGACSLETQSTVFPNLNGPVFTEIP